MKTTVKLITLYIVLLCSVICHAESIHRTHAIERLDYTGDSGNARGMLDRLSEAQSGLIFLEQWFIDNNVNGEYDNIILRLSYAVFVIVTTRENAAFVRVKLDDPTFPLSSIRDVLTSPSLGSPSNLRPILERLHDVIDLLKTCTKPSANGGVDFYQLASTNRGVGDAFRGTIFYLNESWNLGVSVQWHITDGMMAERNIHPLPVDPD